MKSLFLILLISTLSALADEKIGVIDMESAILATSDGKVAQAGLMKEFKLAESKFKDREFSLRDKIKDFDKKAMILSEQKREEQKSELQELTISFQKEMQKFQMDFQRKQLEASKPIVEKLQKHIAKLAKEKDFYIIINKSQGQVLWNLPSADITETIVKMYESNSSS